MRLRPHHQIQIEARDRAVGRRRVAGDFASSSIEGQSTSLNITVDLG
jgi:hypothetical protein